MLVEAVKASGVAQPKPDSKKKLVASLCIMAAFNECIELKAFIVRLAESKLYKELNDIVPKPNEEMVGQRTHKLSSTDSGSPKRRLCDFVMYLFHQAFKCGVKDGTYLIKILGVELCSEKKNGGLAFTGVEVRLTTAALAPAPASALASALA